MTSLADELQHSVKARYTDDVKEEPIDEFLPPIDLCLNEPLVSLEEAVAPILDLFADLKHNVDIAKRQCREIKDNLTQDENAALYMYKVQCELRRTLNRLLRSAERQDLVPFFKYLNLLITALSKLNSIDGVVWRDFYGEDLRKQYSVNQQFTWWGISSCKATSDFLSDKSKERGMTTLFLIECFNGKSIKNHSSIDITENEVILLPGSHFEVVGHMNPTEGLHIIHLKQLKSSPFSLFKPGSGIITQIPLEGKKIPTTTMSLEFNDSLKMQNDEAEPTTKIRTLINKYRGKTNWWLRNQQLTDNDIKELADVLKADETCRTLDLGNNNLSAIAAYQIADLLTANRTLKQLHLCSSQIGDEGAQAIFDVLKYQNNTLADIGLLYSQITDKSVESILQMISLNRTLTDLHLGGNQISPESQKRLDNNTAASRPRVDFIYGWF